MSALMAAVAPKLQAKSATRPAQRCHAKQRQCNLRLMHAHPQWCIHPQATCNNAMQASSRDGCNTIISRGEVGYLARAHAHTHPHARTQTRCQHGVGVGACATAPASQNVRPCSGSQAVPHGKTTGDKGAKLEQDARKLRAQTRKTPNEEHEPAPERLEPHPAPEPGRPPSSMSHERPKSPLAEAASTTTSSPDRVQVACRCIHSSLKTNSARHVQRVVQTYPSHKGARAPPELPRQ